MDLQLSESKLILLYVIAERENIAETDLIDFVIYRMYMDYFTTQSCMDELEEQGLVVKIKSKTDGGFYYTLLPEGDEVVKLFRNRIPHSIREDIRTVSDVEYWYRLLFSGYQFYCIHQILVRNRSHGKQVGKTKVSLFDRELDELHRDIANRLNAYPGADIYDMERYYLGLKKRGITGAAEYTYRKYLKGKIASPMGLHFKAVGYTVLGKGRTFVRDVFRKVKVK